MVSGADGDVATVEDEGVAATGSVDDAVVTKLEDVGGTGGGGGRKGSIGASGADGRTATVEDEGFGRTGSVDDAVVTELGVVVVAGTARDKARACSTRITSRRPLASCIEF